MATTTPELGGVRRLNVLRVAVATSLSTMTFVVLCWIGAKIGFGPAGHMFLSVYSPAEVTSVITLLAGLCWSFLGGAVIGAIYAIIYNALAPLER